MYKSTGRHVLYIHIMYTKNKTEPLTLNQLKDKHTTTFYMEKDDLLSINEFCEILTYLSNDVLTLLYKLCLTFSDEDTNANATEDPNVEHRRAALLRPKKNGQLYNAYCARVLVSNPCVHLQNEIVRRYIQGTSHCHEWSRVPTTTDTAIPGHDKT